MSDPERDEPSLELKMPRLRRPRAKRRSAPEAAPTPAEPEATPATPEPTPAKREPTPAGVEQATETRPPAPQMVADAPPSVAEPEAPPAVRREPRQLPLPAGWFAVVLTGVVVGLVVVGLTWASLRTCEAVQGTATCGTAGYPMLALVVVVAILVGSALLRLTHVPDPVSTSILGVGVASVLALVFLIDHLDQPAMVVVIPLICAATFAGSHWLTTAVIEPADR